MKRFFGRNKPHVHGSTAEDRIATMLSYVPMWVLAVLWAIFVGCFGVAGFSYPVLVSPITSALFAHSAAAIEPHKLPIVACLLVVVGAVTLTLQQSGWLVMRVSQAMWKRRKLVRGEF